MLDLLVAPVVEDAPSASPPTSPAPGACYLIADSPDGAWAGNAQRVAGFTSGGWRFVAPLEGMSAYVRSTGTRAVYRGRVWDLGGAAIASPSGGTTVDAPARSAIDLILSAMRRHGLIAS